MQNYLDRYTKLNFGDNNYHRKVATHSTHIKLYRPIYILSIILIIATHLLPNLQFEKQISRKFVTHVQNYIGQ